MQVKGRYLIIGWTAVFFVVVAAILRREYDGWKLGKAVAAADDSLRALSALTAGLDASIAAVSSRDSLSPKAQALGLRYVSDSNLVTITVPGHR
jgi:hypothetical protein